MKVKICGITRLQDAQQAVSLGAWAVGFIFYRKSPRYIEPEAAREIVKALPKRVRKVGVFVDSSYKAITDVCRVAGVDTIQLHGSESPLLASSLGRSVIKATALRKKGDLALLKKFPHVMALLIDAYTLNEKGGTGKRANWNLALEAKQFGKIILAGGINSKNVAKAFAEVDPWAVDLSSGVESRPGIKDSEKMKILFSAISLLKRKKEQAR
jgi:phosphoribosylanthranilate isomerase